MRGSLRIAVTALCAALSLGGDALATYRTDSMELQARLAMQNTMHHDAVDHGEWVQMRNEFRFDLKYNLIGYGNRFLNLSKARVNFLYRARYDAIFDIRGKYGDLGYRRDDFRFPEGKLPRELFLDFEFTGPMRPLGIRVGRQQVVWGEADLFRSIDVVNPLRLDQNGLIGDDFADYREPLWILKALWEFGQLGPIAQTGIEWFGSLNSRPATHRLIFGEAFRIGIDQNNPVDGFNRRNSRPFRSVRHPWEVSRIGPHKTEAQDFAQLGGVLGDSDFVYLIDNQWPTSEFDPDAAMTGVRLSGQWAANLNFTLNYIWKRTELPGTSLDGTDLFDPDIATDGSPNTRLELLAQAAAFAAIPGGNEELIRRCIHEKEPLFVLDDIHGSGNASSGCLGVNFWYPWTHIAGLTFTYNDYNYTGAVFRLEQSWSSKEPRNHRPPLAGPREGDFPHGHDFATGGMRTTQVYRSMLGADYLRSLNIRAARQWPQPFRSLLGADQWLFSVQLLNEYYTHVNNQIGLIDSVTDRMQHFNPMVTGLMTGFFVNNRLRPWIAMAYDVNAEFPILWLQAEYTIGKRWTVRLGEILYMGSKFSESFLYLHKYADRDTFFARVTYWLL